MLHNGQRVVAAADPAGLGADPLFEARGAASTLVSQSRGSPRREQNAVDGLAAVGAPQMEYRTFGHQPAPRKFWGRRRRRRGRLGRHRCVGEPLAQEHSETAPVSTVSPRGLRQLWTTGRYSQSVPNLKFSTLNLGSRHSWFASRLWGRIPSRHVVKAFKLIITGQRTNNTMMPKPTLHVVCVSLVAPRITSTRITDRPAECVLCACVA